MCLWAKHIENLSKLKVNMEHYTVHKTEKCRQTVWSEMLFWHHCRFCIFHILWNDKYVYTILVEFGSMYLYVVYSCICMLVTFQLGLNATPLWNTHIYKFQCSCLSHSSLWHIHVHTLITYGKMVSKNGSFVIYDLHAISLQNAYARGDEGPNTEFAPMSIYDYMHTSSDSFIHDFYK